MIKTLFITLALIVTGVSSEARDFETSSVKGVSIEDVTIERDGRFMSLSMKLDLSALDVDGNRAVLLTPCVVNGKDSLDLPSIGVYGYRRYYFYVRGGEGMLSGKDEESYKASARPDGVSYDKVFPYEEWMNGAALYLRRREYGCCGSLLSEEAGTLALYAGKVEEKVFEPVLVYARPEAEASKSRSLEGSAFVDFAVNRVDINPGYRRNAAELGKIRSTIDSVKNDRDINITSVWLKGYASPEGKYSINETLALGRTESLKEYILSQYDFPEDLILTEHEAEDWDGLRKYVSESSLGNRQAILDLLAEDIDPDAKEWKLKRDYPEDYRLLLKDCYPALRHTDYRVSYTIRDYTDVEEIKRIMESQPQKLSLNEFYLVAQEYEPGSGEFAEVFETAARMFPGDQAANLNAANAAMSRGDLEIARKYLSKAGDSAEAVYALGALAIKEKDYDTAARLLEKAAGMGLAQASETLEELSEVFAD